MAETSIGTPDQLRDPSYTPALHKAIPLGIPHVLATFVSNVPPALIVASAAGFGFRSNSPGFPELLYLIHMLMLFAGLATLLQTITLGPVGAALPIVQGTSFAFLPIMIPLVAGKGVEAPCRAVWRHSVRWCLSRLPWNVHRQDPVRSATIGHRPCCDDDQFGAGQGRYPICGGWRPCDRYAGIWITAQLVCGRDRHAGPQVLCPPR